MFPLRTEADMSNHPENERLHVAPQLAEFTDCHHHFVGQLHNALYLPELLVSAARARAMAIELLHLFQKGLLAHHDDEERALFPAVQQAALPGRERRRVDAMVEQLVREHRQIAQLWKEVEPAVAEAANGGCPEIAPALMEEIVHDFFAHVHFEEHEFLPLAQEILSRHGELAALGHMLHKRHAAAAAAQGS